MVFNSINNLHNNNISTELTNPIDKFHKFKSTDNTSIVINPATKMNGGSGLCINSLNNDVNKMSNSTHRQSKSSSSSSSTSSSSESSSSTSSSKKQLSTEDKKINLNALKNQDPFATNIVDTAFRVAVYKFVSKKNEWVTSPLFYSNYLNQRSPSIFCFVFF